MKTISIVGVGPGDPELMTIRGARVLAACDAVYHPGPADDAGFAYEIAEPLLRPGQRVRGMALKMMRGPADGSVGYERVAAALAAEAGEGNQVAFLTEGDPMLFGTGSYVLDRLRRHHPEVPVEVVPGVSAIGAAAARLGWALARKDEILTVCPGTYHVEEIGALLDLGGPVCWLKAADVLPRLVAELRARERLACAALIEKVGRPDERIFLDLAAALHEELSYFSLVLVR